MQRNKKLKTRHDDASYHPGQSSATNATGGGHGIFGLDFDPNAVFSFVIEDKGLNAEERERLEDQLALELHNTEKNIRPLLRIEYDENGSPMKGFTPSRGTELFRASKQGVLSILTNHSKMIPTYKFSLNAGKPELTEAEKKELAKFVPVAGNEKVTQQTLSQSSVNAARRDNKSHGSRNQGVIQGGRATRYKELTSLFDDKQKRQWAHLIAYSIGGIKTQTPTNLAAFTEAANGEHQIIEAALRMALAHLKKNVVLKVNCGLVPDTHLATTVEYHFTKDEVLAAFGLYGQTPNKPHTAYKNIVFAYTRSLFGIAPPETKPVDPVKLQEFTTHKSNFFYKRKIATDVETKEPVVTIKQVGLDNLEDDLIVTLDLDPGSSLVAHGTLVISEGEDGLDFAVAKVADKENALSNDDAALKSPSASFARKKLW